MSGPVKLKICGVRRPEDLRACARAGVDAVGINLWPGSPRSLGLVEAVQMVEGAGVAGGRQGGPLRVGVFVDADPRDVVAAHAALELDAVQLHGDSPPARYAGLGLPCVWVLRGAVDLWPPRAIDPPPVWVLLDSQVPGFGGQGRRGDWAWARRVVSRLFPCPVWLAGGITPENAADAIDEVRPAGLDVATGAELPGAGRGEKDHARIAALAAICHKGSV